MQGLNILCGGLECNCCVNVYYLQVFTPKQNYLNLCWKNVSLTYRKWCILHFIPRWFTQRLQKYYNLKASLPSDIKLKARTGESSVRIVFVVFFCLSSCSRACQPLWVILCLPEKGRKRTEELEETRKERKDEGISKWQSQNIRNTNMSPFATCCKYSWAQLFNTNNVVS